jgi:ribosome-associated protein
MIKYQLKSEYIELYKLIKLLDLVDSGGDAKRLIENSLVKRNGEFETRKRAKIRADESIQIGDVIIEVVGK